MIYLYHKLIYETGACVYLNPNIAHCLKAVLYKISYDLKGNIEDCELEYIEDAPYIRIKNKENIKEETNELINQLFNFIIEIKNYKTIIKQIDKETPGLLYLIFENKENVSEANIANINKGIELFKEMSCLRCQIINKYKYQIRDFINKREIFLQNIDLIGKKAYDLKLSNIYDINFLNRDDEEKAQQMYKTIREAKKNMEQILKEENNIEIINSHESIIEEYQENL